MIKTITPTELDHLRRRGDAIDLIDVRTPIEFREIHVENATNAPLESLDPKAIMAARNGASGRPLYLICQTGSRGEKACKRFIACGFENVVKVEGGTLAWAEKGLPVKRGKKAVSLERQVRIAAGFLVVLGVALGFFVTPYFYLLSAMVGAGLMQAGITDTCPMAILFAKMPWNQIRSHSGGEAAKEQAGANDAPATEASCSL
jgi:rhodanese-related sulfurtransferase